MAVKSCKVATKNVSDMGKELSRISQVSSVGALADQMAEAEQSKTEVETQLQERVRPFFSYSITSDLDHVVKTIWRQLTELFCGILPPSRSLKCSSFYFFSFLASRVPYF